MKTIIFIVLFLMVIFRSFLMPGPKVASDFPLLSREEMLSRFSSPQAWLERSSEGLGQNFTPYLWFWPTDFLYGLGAKAGLNFSLIEQIFFFVPFLIISTWGIIRLLDHLGIKGQAKLIASLFYVSTTYVILAIDGGQFAIALSYAWMPLAYLSVETSIGGSLARKIKAGLAVSVLGFFDIRFVYILALLLAARFVFRRRELLEWIKSGLVIGITLAGLNAFWLLPAVLSGAPGLPSTYQRIAQTSFLSFSSLGHSLTLLQPHWYLNVFGKITPLLPEFFLIPILVFLAPVLRKRDKTVAFWLLIALVSVFLAKGANPPLPQIYTWLFSHLPGFSLFRDSTKFFFLVALSYAILIGITIDEIVKRLGKRALIVPLFLAGYFIFLARPVWLGKMTGTFSNPPYQKEYSELTKRLEADKDFGRILWIPSRTPLGFSSPLHPSVEALRLIERRPFASSVVGSYELTNFIRQSYMGELFDVSGIEYISYPFPDTRREELKPDNIKYYNWFLGNISNLDWTSPVATNSPVPLIAAKKHQDRFFLANGPFFVIGSDGIYRDLPDGTLASNALIFAEEKPGTASQIFDFSGAKVILFGKNETDLAASFLNGSSIIFPAKNLDFSPNGSGWPASNASPARSRYSVSGERSDAGWWKRETADLISWRNFLHEKYGLDNLDFDYGGGWAVAEGETRHTISDVRFKKDSILLARVMDSPKGGRVEFYQGDKLIGNIDTLLKNPESVLVGDKQHNGADFHWFEVGSLKSDEPLTIKTSGDINVINALAALDIQGWNRANRRINELIHQYRVFEWDKLTPSLKQELFNSRTGPNVSYERLSSTHYQVKVEGLREPRVLAFSETYDPLWQINGKQSIKLYSLINGFPVHKDGIYDVYFTAQKYVYPGLVVSGITLFLVAGGLVFLKRRKDEN